MSARPEWLAPSRRDGPVGPASRALGRLWAHRAQHARTQYVSSAVHLSTVIAGRENLSPRVWLDPIRGHLENAQRREAVNEIGTRTFWVSEPWFLSHPIRTCATFLPSEGTRTVALGDRHTVPGFPGNATLGISRACTGREVSTKRRGGASSHPRANREVTAIRRGRRSGWGRARPRRRHRRVGSGSRAAPRASKVSLRRGGGGGLGGRAWDCALRWQRGGPSRRCGRRSPSIR